MASHHIFQDHTTYKIAQDRDDPVKVTRPLNSFMLYKRDYKYKYLKENPRMNSRDISRVVAERWRNEAESVKNAYRDQAASAMKAHKIKYPNYRYSKSLKKKSYQKAKKARAPIVEGEPQTVAGDLLLDIPEYPDSILSDVIQGWEFSLFNF